MKTMKAPDGVKEVHFEGMRYAVDEEGMVSLPDHANSNLYQFGFVDIVAPDETPGSKRTQKTS